MATAAGAEFDEFYVNDGLYRLKQMQRGTLNSTNTGITSPTFGQCWTLDPTGNWMGFNEASSGGSWTTVQTRTANPVNEITAITNTVGSPWASPAYDAAGNMTTMPQPARPGDSYTAKYDAWNRLMTLSNGDSVVQNNQYDARTFRTIRITPSSFETRHFYYTRAWRVVEERAGTATAADRQFIWGVQYIDDLVLRDYGSQRLYAAQDANWNVTSTLDTTATVQERYAYSLYGAPFYLSASFSPLSTSSYNWETLYSGYRISQLTSLYDIRFRVYHYILGAWTTRDPRNSSRQRTPYQYVASKPLSFLDPSGLKDEPHPFDKWWPPYEEFLKVNNFTAAQIADRKSTVHRGCVGLTIAGLGYSVNHAPYMQMCYSSYKDALAAGVRLKCDTGRLRMFAIAYWREGGEVQSSGNDPFGNPVVDMTEWWNSPKSSKLRKKGDWNGNNLVDPGEEADSVIPFDFYLLNKNENDEWYWIHADHNHNPKGPDGKGTIFPEDDRGLGAMTVLYTPLSDRIGYSNLPYLSYCLACQLPLGPLKEFTNGSKNIPIPTPKN